MLPRISTCLLLAAALACPLAAADNRDIQELQRDVAQLQEMVKNLQQGLDQRFAAVGSQIQSVAATVDKVNASVAALGKSIDQASQDQGKVVPLIAAQGTRIEQSTSSLNTVQQAVADLTSTVNKLQAQMTDLGNTVKMIASPPPPPPGSEKPPVAAADLLNNAEGDRVGGKLDLALQEYSDYLKYYGDTPMANAAQFRVGMLHYSLKEFETAVNDFDTLAQKYPDSSNLAEALFYKRKSLQALGRNAEAAKACQDLRKQFPASEFARQCVSARH